MTPEQANQPFMEWRRQELPEDHAKLTPLPPEELPGAEPEGEERIPIRYAPNVQAAMSENEKRHGISPRHYMIAVLYAQGAQKREICEQLGYAEQKSIDAVLQRPSIRALVEEMQDRFGLRVVGARLSRLAPKAIAVLESALDASLNTKDSGKLQVEAAKDILNRVFPTVSINLSGDADLRDLSDAELMQRARGVN